MSNNIFAAIRRLFQHPSADILAQEELEQAKRELLSAQNAKEYYEAQSQYNEQRIARLTRYVGAV